MTSRSLWLLLALLLGFGGPFVAVAFVQPAVGWPLAITVAVIALAAAAWVVRRSRTPDAR